MEKWKYQRLELWRHCYYNLHLPTHSPKDQESRAYQNIICVPKTLYIMGEITVNISLKPPPSLFEKAEVLSAGSYHSPLSTHCGAVDFEGRA